MRITVTGGSGFIGSHLIQALLERGEEVVCLTRSAEKTEKQFPKAIISTCNLLSERPSLSSIQGSNVIIHLAGDPIAEGAWSGDKKKIVFNSRVVGTRHLLQSLRECPIGNRPSTLIMASAIGIYGNRGEELLTEESGAGSGFFAHLVSEWEKQISLYPVEGVRVVVLRLGAVLNEKGGMMKSLIPLIKWGGGMTLGSGEQWMSWIDLRDLVQMIIWSIDNSEVSGILNAVSPTPIRHQLFMNQLGDKLSRKIRFKGPEWLVKWALGDRSELVLMGQKVAPKRALELGFSFSYPKFDMSI